MTDFLFKHSSYFIISPLYDVDIHKPYLFMVEGIDGAGKTTFAKELQKAFNIANIPCQTVHEPFDPLKLPANPTAKDFQKDREEHYKQHPLDNKTWLISDRSIWSTLAYNDCSFELTRSMERWYEETFKHYNKVLFYLSASEPVTIARLKERGEMEEIEKDRRYQLEVKNKYKELISGEEVHVDVRAIVNTTYTYPLYGKPSPLKKHNYLDTDFTEEEIKEALGNE